MSNQIEQPGIPKVPLAAAPAESRVCSLTIPSDGALIFSFLENPRASEQYRAIRTRILRSLSTPAVIGVSSASPQDGKTTTSINLCGVLAMKPELRILLLEGDLWQSSIAKTLGLPPSPGLANILEGEIDWRSALIRTEQYPNLYVLPAGVRSQAPADLLSAPAWLELIQQLRTCFTHIVVDCPPLGITADIELIEPAVDGMVVVVRPDNTVRILLKRSLERIDPAKMLGLVVNGATDWALYKHEHSYYDAYYRKPPE